MGVMASEVIYNQLVREFAANDQAPFTEYVAPMEIQHAVW